MRILSKEEAYLADDYTINKFGIKSTILMENAGSALLHATFPYLNKNSKIICLVGAGNNGGDGLVLCRRLYNLGFNVAVFLISSPSKFKGDSLYELNVYKNHKYPLYHPDENSNTNYLDFLFENIKSADFIIDSILGIGFKGCVYNETKPILNAINNSDSFVVSIDLPSGVSADGAYYLDGIKADVTISVGGFKESCFIYPSSYYFGEVLSVDIGLVFPPEIPVKQTWDFYDFSRSLHIKNMDENKGDSGHALIIGGSKFYKGAPILTSLGCLKSGIGLLSLAVTDDIKSSSCSIIPEAIYAKTKDKNGYLDDFSIPDKTDIIVCGMGISRKKHIKAIIQKVILSDQAIVLDADALYFLDDHLLTLIKNRKGVTILTPHPGEMAHLCGLSVDEVQKSRFSLSYQKTLEWNCYLVLKGPYTIISTNKGDQFVNTSGNPSLAKGGSGDVLAGVIASFVSYALKNKRTFKFIRYSFQKQFNCSSQI